MERQALRRPICTNPIELHRLGDVGFQRCCLAADGRVTCFSYLGIGSVYLLHNRAGETAELRDFPFEKFFAEVEITEDPIQRVAVFVVGRCLKEGRRDLRPASQRGGGQLSHPS